MNQLLQNLKTFLSRHTLQQKLGMAGAAVMVVSLLWAMVHYVGKVEMQVLYADMNPEEANSVVGKLGTLQVPYELAQDGRSIRVPADKIAELRLQLASEGLPQSGRIGMEIFDRANFGLTTIQEQIFFQRALEGELTRSVMTLREVSGAHIHLVLGKESLYQASENQTKASVLLKMKSGRSVPASTVQGIVHMVASSVKDLSPERVTVIDDRGRLLSRADGEDGQQLEARSRLESDLTSKIVKILEPAVGPGRVRPQVSVAMNFQRSDETIDLYDPDKSVVVSHVLSADNSVGAGAVGGVVSPKPPPLPPASTASAADPNVPASKPAAPPSNSRQNETTNYLPSKTVRHVINPVGMVERMSVAVLVDNAPVPPTAPGAKPAASSPRKPEEMKKFRDLVEAAIGLNAMRGDQLTVENVSFESDVEAVHEAQPYEKYEKYIPQGLTALRYLMIPVVFLLLYLLFIRPVQKNVFASWAPAVLTAGNAGVLGPGVTASIKALPTAGGAQAPMTVRQLEARLHSQSGTSTSGDQNSSDADALADTPERELLPLPAPSRMEQIRKRVVEHTKKDPETVARLVRVWLNEEKNK